MLLLDHFNPPLRTRSQWGSFHTAWMTHLAADLNTGLPKRFFAAPSAQLGIEIDVAALERFRDADDGTSWTPTWTPPAATATLPFATATDELEVLVHEDYPGEMRLVGAVEFVSPANKDRPETRAAFVSKCHGYLLRGVGVLVVDVVTDRHANLHDDLLDRVGGNSGTTGGHLYTAAYHATGGNGVGELGLWFRALAVGGPLPDMPLWLLGGICVPARLGDTYQRTCHTLRIFDLLGVPPPSPAPTP